MKKKTYFIIDKDLNEVSYKELDKEELNTLLTEEDDESILIIDIVERTFTRPAKQHNEMLWSQISEDRFI